MKLLKAWPLAVALLLLSATLPLSSTAWADSARRTEILDADGPPALPGLSHRNTAFNFEYMLASAEPTDVSSAEAIPGERAFAYSARWLVEAPLAPRIWYFGASSSLAAASVPSSEAPGTGGSTLVLGNPKLWMRALWTSEAGLAAGGGASLVVPVPRKFSPLEHEVVRAVRVVRPGDFPQFQDLALTGQPFFDIRHVIGPVTLQMRQGLAFTVLLRDPDEHENRYDLTVVASGYIGLKTIEQLTLGLEVVEAYELTADVSSPACPEPCDQHRAQVTLSPSVRLRLPPLSPALSAVFPVSTPLRAEVTSYYAARLHLDVTF